MDIIDLAKIFLSIEPMTHKKLQILCYYAEAWYLTIHKMSLIDTSFQAWESQPINTKLYYKYKHYGSHTIESNDTPPEVSPSILKFVKEIHNQYGTYSLQDLQKHIKKETPYKNARGNLPENAPSSEIISNTDIINYYSNYPCQA